MCFHESRRRFLTKSVLGGSLTLVAGGAELSHLGILKSLNDELQNSNRWETLAQLLLSAPKDKADRKPTYLNGTDMSFWHAQIHPILKTIVPRLLPSQPGALIELGSYKGQSADILEQAVGHAVTRLDIFPYYQHEHLVIGDIRKNPLPDQPARLVWNDVSSWRGSPRSRLEAFNYARRNLVSGGIYIDDRFADIPKDLDLSGFKLVQAKGYVSIFKRV